MSCNKHTDNLLVEHRGLLTASDRLNQLNHRAITIWLTGLSASGKSTLAYTVEYALHNLNIKTYVLDGDNVRHRVNKDLGFSAEDRSENIRRVAEIANLMNDAGLVVICAFICPNANDRLKAKEIIGPDRFFEVYVSTSIEICETRDPKLLYKKARSGELKNFTGVSAPYEIPKSPDICIDTGVLSLESSVNNLLSVAMPKIIVHSKCEEV